MNKKIYQPYKSGACEECRNRKSNKGDADSCGVFLLERCRVYCKDIILCGSFLRSSKVTGQKNKNASH